ncbi:MAG: hypothetical protein K940chlam1_00293 [Candidatus Anoxychlamydiales bacterium]|nr:hypothetical protein [Candidatus Anoxychlamydiales bacterium]NGX36092.1 hypothetical protein [Candidatus Anoxychlamydiales bacterium]
MSVSTISDEREIESFDITEKVQYKGDKLDKSDLKKLYEIIIDLGKSLNVSREILNNTQIEISGDAFGAKNKEIKIIIPELEVLILLEKLNFQEYIKNSDTYDLQVYQALCENNVSFLRTKINFRKNPLNYFENNRFTTPLEAKAALAHEFGHLVDENLPQKERLFVMIFTLMSLTATVPAILLTNKLKEKYDAKLLDINTITSSIVLFPSIILCGLTFIKYIKTRLFRSSEIYADNFVKQNDDLSCAFKDHFQRSANIKKTIYSFLSFEYRLGFKVSEFFDAHQTNQHRALSFQQALKKA